MKNIKKLLCAFIAIAIAASCVAVPAFAEEQPVLISANVGTVFSDVAGTESYADAVIMLNKLSIINGYEDGTFGPMNNVTRSEFAALLLRMLGMDQTAAPAEKPFTDVDTLFWAAGTINAAKTMGIITGYEDGTFRPLNNVSYEEALTMIIRAIGYENFSAPSQTVWYESYYNSAQKLGITKNAVGSLGTPATRSCIAQLIYDTLGVNTRKDGLVSNATIMEAYLGIYKEEGILASNTYTSLETPDVNLKANEIMIMVEDEDGDVKNVVYKVQNTKDYDDMLGANITFYYKPGKGSDYGEIIMCDVKKNTKQETVTAAMIEPADSSATKLAYYKSESAKNVSYYNIDSENVVIYNGKLYGDSPEASRFNDNTMIPAVGQISLLNRDGDNDYDVLFIDSYEVYAVSSVTSSTYKITDNITTPSSPRTKILNYTDDNQIISFVDIDGRPLSFSAIKKNKAICVKESHANSGTKLVTVVIMGNAVNGEVKSRSNDSVTVGTQDYKYSPMAPWVSGSDTVPEPSKGETYSFFMDINNEIFAYIADENAAAVSYGYIIDCSIQDGSGFGDESGSLQILTQSGAKTWFSLHSTSKINGRNVDGDVSGAMDDLVEASYNTYGVSDYKQAVKYSTKTIKGEPVIDELITVTDAKSTGATVAKDEFILYEGAEDFTRDEETTFSQENRNFGNSVFLSNATVFIVPESGEPDDFKKGSTSDFNRDGGYKVEIFDITSSKNAKLVVLYGTAEAFAVNHSTPLFRFDRVENTYDEITGETLSAVYGWENGAYGDDEWSQAMYYISDNSEEDIEDLSKGDLVRFGADANGYVTLKAEDIHYSYGDTEPFFFAWDNNYDRNEDAAKRRANSDTKIIMGTLYSAGKDGIVVVLDPEDDVADLTQAINVSESMFGGANFFSYDTTGSEVEITYLGTGAECFDGYSTYEKAPDSAAKVLVHITSGTPRMVIIFDAETETEE
ncbi:MAG: S-layer homology domain-containing protein [Clostridia bacterium]|nr:S-layer homology domain-containing protein [Clostridia bacterium]